MGNTSCLILFYKIGELDLLKKLFGKLHITDTVLKEFNQPVPDWIEVVQLKTDLHKGLSGYLDPGKAAEGGAATESVVQCASLQCINGLKTDRKSLRRTISKIVKSFDTESRYTSWP